MSATVGEIGLNLVLNRQDFSKSLNAVQEQANSVSNKMSAKLKKLGTAVVAAFSVAAVKKFGQQCIESAAEVNAANSQFEQTFGSMQSQAESAIATVSKNSGILKTRLQGVGTSIYAFAKTTGMDSANALNMMQEALQVTADSAAYYDRSLEDTAESLKSFLKGNFENDAALGLSCTETTRNAAANKLYGKSFVELSESQKQLTLLEMVKDANKLSGALGQASRESDGWENVTGNLKESWNQLLAVIGKPILQVATNIVQKLSSAITKLTEYAKNAVNSLSDLFNFDGSNTASNISTAANAAQGLSDEASNSSTALDNVASSAEKAKRSIAGFDKLNILTKTDTTATDTTQSGSTTVNNGSVTSTVSKKTNSLTQSKTLESFKTALTNIKGVVSSIGTSWRNVWNNGTGKKFLENINSLLDTAFSTIGDIAGAFKKAWDKAGLGDSVVQSFIDKWNSLVELVNTVGDTFREVWNDGKGEKIWGNILDIIRNCNNFTETLRNKIKEAWDKNNTGKKIWENILGIVEDITGFLDDMSQIRLEWLENLNLDPVAKAAETLSGAFRDLSEACGDKLKQAYKTILLPLAKWTIEKVVPDLLNAFAGALKGISDIIKKISPSVLKAVAGGIGAVATAVITFKTGKAIASGISEVTSAVKNISSVISANPLLVIASAITGIVLAVQAYNDCRWSNSEAKKFCDELQGISDDLQGTCDGITEKVENTLNTLDQKYAENTLIDDYQEKLETLLNKAELSPSEMAQLQTIVTYFEDNVDGFKDTWDRYVEISDDNTVNLKGDLGEVSSELNNLINNYQKAANAAALSALQQENVLEKITANKNLSEVKETMSSKMNEIDSAYAQLEKKLSSRGYTMNDFFQSYGTINGGINFREESQMYDDIKEMCNAYDDLKEQYNEATAKVNELTMTNDDLIDVQKVLNGDYSDAAAVLMAYNQQMISQNDILSATDENGEKIWKSLSDVKVAAEDSGKNTVIGLVKGTQTYKDALVKNSNGLANTVLSEYDSAMDIHSPSREMYKRGQYTVLGLVNGLSDTSIKVQSVITMMLNNIRNALEPIKTIFSNVFTPIYNILKTPLNNVLTGLENFINGFISAINKMLSGVDTVANSIGKLFGQEWHAGRLNKVTLPRLAKGGLVKAPTLAVVGDNAGANSGNPEVVAPLSKLQGMINTSNGEDTVILGEILSYLKKLYEMFVIFRNNGGNYYQFVAEINGNDIFNEIVKQNELYKNRHNGKSAFA